MLNMIRYTLNSVMIMLIIVGMTASVAYAEESDAKRFVVMLDADAMTSLVKSQEHASANPEEKTNELSHAVKLKESFGAESESYVLLEAPDKSNVNDYLKALELSPISVIETEFTNSPEVGGGPKALEEPREGHKIYVIERGVPGISSMPMEKQIEVSQGSQKVVSQFGDKLEWDKSFLTQEGTFCVYRTDNEELIKEHASIAGFPADKISVVDHKVYDL